MPDTTVPMHVLQPGEILSLGDKLILVVSSDDRATTLRVVEAVADLAPLSQINQRTREANGRFYVAAGLLAIAPVNANDVVHAIQASWGRAPGAFKLHVVELADIAEAAFDQTVDFLLSLAAAPGRALRRGLGKFFGTGTAIGLGVALALVVGTVVVAKSGGK